jgi:ankyrin repeat protein
MSYRYPIDKFGAHYDPNATLKRATRLAQYEKAKILIADKTCLDNYVVQAELATALQMALEVDDTPMADLIIKNGLDVKQWRKMYGWDSLYSAVMQPNIVMAKYLLDKGVNPNEKDKYSLLGTSVGCNNLEMTKFLIDRGGANVNDKNICICNLSLFLFAVSRNYLEIVKLLLDRGVDPYFVMPRSNVSALNYALSNDSLEMVKLLLDRGDPQRRYNIDSCSYGYPFKISKSELDKLLLDRN